MKFSEYFEYSEESPSGLIWIKNKGSKIKPGDKAGSKSFSDSGNPKCWDVRLDGKLYKAHRIICELLVGPLSDADVINHIDCNPFNNKFSNLEIVDQKTNSRRCSHHVGVRLQSNNSSGINGVREVIRNGILIAHTAFWRDLDGVIISKWFSCKEYGEELSKILAETTRSFNIKLLNECGAGYAEKEQHE